MRIAGINENDIINGEGVSVSLWMQGCPFHCKGCHNPETWDYEGGQEINFIELENKILVALQANGIQRNFSILGGEPLAPRNKMYTFDIIYSVRKHFPNIKIFVWTGYELENLDKNILQDIDVLITGQYKEELRDITQKWKGSSNQKILYKGVDF